MREYEICSYCEKEKLSNNEFGIKFSRMIRSKMERNDTICPSCQEKVYKDLGLEKPGMSQPVSPEIN